MGTWEERKEMFCKFCGTKLDDNAQFCPSCGNAVAAGPNTEPPQQPAGPADWQGSGSQQASGQQSYYDRQGYPYPPQSVAPPMKLSLIHI